MWKKMVVFPMLPRTSRARPAEYPDTGEIRGGKRRARDGGKRSDIEWGVHGDEGVGWSTPHPSQAAGDPTAG